MMIYCFIAIFFILLGLGIFLFLKYSKIKDFSKNIEICEDKINKSLEKKEKLISDVLDIIKNDKLNKSFKYNKEDSIYERESSLFNIRWDINKYFIDNEDLISNDIKSILKKLDRTEDNLEGLKDYFNANVLNYNELFNMKFLNLLFKLLKFENVKSFKVRRIDDYEILKD